MAWQSVPLKEKIGSEIHVGKEELLNGGLRDDIRVLLVERGVIVFRDNDLSDAEQRGLARQLGDLRTGTTAKEGDEGLMKITLSPKENPDYVDYFPGSLLWHMDGTYDAVPPFATILRQHPLVWRHQSGRKSLALSTSCSHIVGMPPADSHDLLNRLMAHATGPEFVYRHEWRPNDLLMWDNTGTMRRARPYDPDADRLLHRFTLNGEEPIAAIAA